MGIEQTKVLSMQQWNQDQVYFTKSDSINISSQYQKIFLHNIKNISSQCQKYYAMKFSKYYQNFSQCSQGFVYKMFIIIDIDFGKSQHKFIC